VRVEARFAWNVATAWSMRRFKPLESSLSAGIPAMIETAMMFRPRCANDQRLFY
jgi:hypothetical protein